MQRLARLLDVDEIHVTDEDGVIIYSSVGKYVGVDFRKGKQTSEFLSILEDYKESNYFVQDEQPNTAEGKVMKYVAVARRGKKGIVQVGLDPERQKKETERNTYKYIFSLFPTDEGEELFSIDCDTDTLTALSGGMPDDSIAKRYTLERFQDCTQGGLRQKKDGTYWYVVTKEYNNTLIGASIPVRVLFFKLLFNLLETLLCLVCVEIIMLVLLNYLVNKKVIIGIHQILNGLNRITDGNYDMTIEVGGNPEFEQLSRGINTMVKSVRHSSDRLAKILEMSEVPLVAFEYQEEWGHVYVTKGLKEILNLTDMDIDSFYQDKQLFINRLQEIMSHPIKGDKDIYRVTKDQYVKIHFMTEEIPYHKEALSMADLGMIPEGAYRNRKYASEGVSKTKKINRALEDILYDPQTSGGLMIAVSENDAKNLLEDLQNTIPCAKIIGYIEEKEEKSIILE